LNRRGPGESAPPHPQEGSTGSPPLASALRARRWRQAVSSGGHKNDRRPPALTSFIVSSKTGKLLLKQGKRMVSDGRSFGRDSGQHRAAGGGRRRPSGSGHRGRRLGYLPRAIVLGRGGRVRPTTNGQPCAASPGGRSLRRKGATPRGGTWPGTTSPANPRPSHRGRDTGRFGAARGPRGGPPSGRRLRLYPGAGAVRVDVRVRSQVSGPDLPAASRRCASPETPLWETHCTLC